MTIPANVHGYRQMEDDMGFFIPSCGCGWVGPPCPDEETATDFYGDHRGELVHQLAGRTNDVLGEVKEERERQDTKWGGPEHDDRHPLSDFADYIAGRVHGIRGGRNERANLVEIAALAVAAIESMDRKASVHESSTEQT